MTREEAIKEIKSWAIPSERGREVLETLIPELAESEDERIIRLLRELGSLDAAKELYEEFNLSYTDVLYWLEKQKDASKAIEAVERIDKYIDKNLANAHDMKDSNPDKKYYRGWDDALGEMYRILQDIYSVEKHKEQEPVDEQFPPLEGLDAIKAKYYDDGFKNGFDEGVESVKPAEWSAKGRRGRIGSTPEHIRKKAENFLSKMEPPYDADDICSAYETGAMESIKQEWSEDIPSGRSKERGRRYDGPTQDPLSTGQAVRLSKS